MRAILPLFAASALFLLAVALAHFALWGLALALLLGGGVYLAMERWQGKLLGQGPSRAARERLAMKEAWRRGGFLRPRDLYPFLPEAEAREVLEALAERGLCRKEGEGYRF